MITMMMISKMESAGPLPAKVHLTVALSVRSEAWGSSDSRHSRRTRSAAHFRGTAHTILHLMPERTGWHHGGVENWEIKNVVAVSPMNHDECDAAYLLKVAYGDEIAEVVVEFAAPSSVASGGYAEEVVRRFLADDEPPQRVVVERDGSVRVATSPLTAERVPRQKIGLPALQRARRRRRGWGARQTEGSFVKVAGLTETRLRRLARLPEYVGFDDGTAGIEERMFLFGPRRFGRMGPLGIAFSAYQLWRRLSPQQKQSLRSKVTAVVDQARAGRRPAARSEELLHKPREATVSEANQPEPVPDEGIEKPDEPSPAEQAQDEQARQEETGQESPT
jgi:hypothetical protein